MIALFVFLAVLFGDCLCCGDNTLKRCSTELEQRITRMPGFKADQLDHPVPEKLHPIMKFGMKWFKERVCSHFSKYGVCIEKLTITSDCNATHVWLPDNAIRKGIKLYKMIGDTICPKDSTLTDILSKIKPAVKPNSSPYCLCCGDDTLNRCSTELEQKMTKIPGFEPYQLDHPVPQKLPPLVKMGMNWFKESLCSYFSKYGVCIEKLTITSDCNATHVWLPDNAIRKGIKLYKMNGDTICAKDSTLTDILSKIKPAVKPNSSPFKPAAKKNSSPLKSSVDSIKVVSKSCASICLAGILARHFSFY